MPLTAASLLAAILLGLAFGALFSFWMQRGRTRLEQARLESLSMELAQRTAERDQLRAERDAHAKTIARLEERLTAGKEAFDQARNDLGDTFRSLATKALADNNQAFLTVARSELEKQQESASSDLTRKETAISELLKPVRESLQKLEQGTQQMEAAREGAYKEVLTEIKNIRDTHESLRRETTQLVQALRAPKVRGNWGELQLRRCIEFAGMVEHASFDVEVFVRGEEASIRPDCVIHLPNQRTIVIDVKTPFDAFLDAMSATDETIRALKLAAHAQRVRQHLDSLSAKSYWKQFETSPDFVVCFLSSEVLFSAALEQDPGLIEYGSNGNVLLATPTTLIALLKAVAYGWQQVEITRNAIAIRKAGEELYDKLSKSQDYFVKMGNALNTAVKQYNSLVGCVEGRGSIFSLARKLHELGIGQEEQPETPVLETATRALKADDWQSNGEEAAVHEV